MVPAPAPGLAQVQVLPPDAGGDESPARSAVGTASTARYGKSVLEALSASSGFGFSVGACGSDWWPSARTSAEDRPQCGQTVTTDCRSDSDSGTVAACKGRRGRRMIGKSWFMFWLTGAVGLYGSHRASAFVGTQVPSCGRWRRCGRFCFQKRASSSRPIPVPRWSEYRRQPTPN